MFFTSKNKKVDGVLDFLRKKRTYNRDLLKSKQLAELGELETELKTLSAKDAPAAEIVDERLKKAEERLIRIFPALPSAGLRENLEVIFVAVVIALALRAYVVQPFKIPTGSMEPTLMGINVETDLAAAPNLFVRIKDFCIGGKSYHTLDGGPQGGTVTAMAEQDFLGIPFLPRTLIRIGDRTEVLWTNLIEMRSNSPVVVGDELAPGEKKIFAVLAGDHVFVNKFIYHFRKPNLGEVFVFTTQGIERIEESQILSGVQGSQFYIKRCVGLSGDTLFLKPPYLYVNGKILDNRPVFNKMYQKIDGYPGYEAGSPPNFIYLTAGDPSIAVPAQGYWAMGDNSPHSFDSRGWGPVPRQNLVGTGMLVYWPFTKRWGLIN
jgi:signal peptidase I